MYLCLCGIRSGGVRGKRIGSFGAVNLRIGLVLHKCIDHCVGPCKKSCLLVFSRNNLRLDILQFRRLFMLKTWLNVFVYGS